MLDEPLGEYVLSQFRVGALADDVIAELEREQADAAERDREREQARRRLMREVSALEGNLDRLRSPASCWLPSATRGSSRRSPRSGRNWRRWTQPRPPRFPAADAGQVAAVRALLDNLEPLARSLPADARRDVLAVFLDRVTLTHDGPTLLLRLEWVTGHVQTLEVTRPDYGAEGQVLWTEADDARLREGYPVLTAAELAERFPGRTLTAIRMRAHHMGLRRAVAEVYRGGGGPRWTPEHDAALRRYAAGELSVGRLRLETGRSWESIRGRMATLKLRRQGVRSRSHAAWRVVEAEELSFESDNSGCFPACLRP